MAGILQDVSPKTLKKVVLFPKHIPDRALTTYISLYILPLHTTSVRVPDFITTKSPQVSRPGL